MKVNKITFFGLDRSGEKFIVRVETNKGQYRCLVPACHNLPEGSAGRYAFLTAYALDQAKAMEENPRIVIESEPVEAGEDPSGLFYVEKDFVDENGTMLSLSPQMIGAADATAALSAHLPTTANIVAMRVYPLAGYDPLKYNKPWALWNRRDGIRLTKGGDHGTLEGIGG